LVVSEEEETKEDVKMKDLDVTKKDDEELPYKNREITVLYFGAGRGPLIRRALSAAK